jgi:hypothetical protein
LQVYANNPPSAFKCLNTTAKPYKVFASFQISKSKFRFDRGRHKQILSNLISTPQESFLLLFQISKIKFQFDRGWYKQVLSKCLSAPLESFLIFTSARPVDDEADAKIGKNKEY